ncbi:MAG: Hpt domain-containing protein [Agathobacter sp.]|nr:Hpt domain-containing protein [Agathobacter sp.]
MTIKECYLRLDGDYDDIMERLGTEKLVERFMLKFPQEGERQMAALHEAMENEDIEECFKVAHTLKGVSANLSITGLYQKASALTEQLRPLTNAPDPKLVIALKEEYDHVLTVLQDYVDEKEEV